MGAGGRAGAGPGPLKGKRRLFAPSAGETGPQGWRGWGGVEGAERVRNQAQHGGARAWSLRAESAGMRTAAPSSPGSALGLPRRCLLAQPPLFASRWVPPAYPRIRCGPRLSALEDQISLWLPGCDGKRLGNCAASWRPCKETGVGKRWQGASSGLGRRTTTLGQCPGAPPASPRRTPSSFWERQ